MANPVDMGFVVIPLDSFVLSDRTGLVSLTATTSLSLMISTEGSLPRTAQQLADLTKNGNLWIMRTGSCRLVVSPSVNGEDVDLSGESTLWDDMATHIEHCEVFLPGIFFCAGSNRVRFGIDLA
jgi:hypothetical protein